MLFVWILWVGILTHGPLLTMCHSDCDSGKPSHRVLKPFIEFKYINFTFQSAEEQKGYDPKDMVPIDSYAQKLYDSEHPSESTYRIFMTLWGGNFTPASLCTVSNQVGKGGNLLTPYPDWSWASSTDCDHCFLNVFRMAPDESSQILVVLDSGATRSGRTCPPKFGFIDLKHNKVLKTVIIPPPTDDSGASNLLVNVAIISRGPGELNYFLVATDVIGHRMLLYKDFKFKWISSPAFQSNPDARVVTSGGYSISLTDGVISLATFMDKLYFGPFTSFDLSVTTIKHLKKAHSTGNLIYKSYKNAFSSQVPTMAVSPQGALLFVLTKEMALTYMDTRNITGGETILEQDSEALQFASSTRVVENKYLFVFTDRFTRYYSGQLDLSEINYRLLYADVSALAKGTHISPHGSDESNADSNGSSNGSDDSKSNEDGSNESHGRGSNSNDKSNDGNWNESDGGNSKSNEGGSNKSHGSGSNSNEGGSNESHGSGSNSNEGGSNESHGSGSNSNDKNNGNWNESNGGNSKSNEGGSNESHGSGSNINDKSNDGNWNEGDGRGDDGNSKNSDSGSKRSHESDNDSNSNSSEDSSTESHGSKNSQSNDKHGKHGHGHHKHHPKHKSSSESDSDS